MKILFFIILTTSLIVYADESKMKQETRNGSTNKLSRILTEIFNCDKPKFGMCQEYWILNKLATCTLKYDKYGCFDGCICITI